MEGHPDFISSSSILVTPIYISIILILDRIKFIADFTYPALGVIG